MIIISGYTLAKNTEDRDASIAAFATMVSQARQQDGCVDFAIAADSVEPTRSNLIEIWRDEKAWKAWRKVARGPKFRPAGIHVSLYRCDTVERLA